MMAWTSEELTRIGTAGEMRIASLRSDGTLRSPVTIWVVRLGDELYVRSVNGRTAAWFRGAEVRHQGHIRAGGVDKDVTFLEADEALNDRIDAEYRSKYGTSSSAVNRITSAEARSTTLELVPR